MPSTYTTNLGIEKPATGEQSGTWGETVNLNYDMFDQAINGIVSVTLATAGSSGSPNTLPITDGAVSNGRNKFIEFVDGGDLGATAYVQLTPNDAEKIVHIRNSLSGSRTLILFQGTYNASNDFEVPNGKDVLVKFSGTGTGATVTDVFSDFKVSGVDVTTLKLNGVDVTATAAELNILDGVTATTAELNFVDGVTSAIQTQLNGKQATITGAATTITSSDLTVSRALVSDGSGKVAISTVTSTELGYVSGVTSGIQGQINALSGSGGTAVWGGITGTLSDQTDLQSALDAKAALGTATTTAINKTIVVDEFCTVTAAGVTITLPASPAAGARVAVGVLNFVDTVIARNSQNIMGLAEDLTIDVENVTVSLRFVDATRGWKII